ncbi:SIR2-domain-containing protein [Pisolithus marmoratus]|nr:SIR2-domain-containing protein [Pisolithus marmoratus]
MGTSEQQQAVSHENARAKPKISPLHEMQLRAFLSAADDVDADSDTLDDLMDGVGEDICSSMIDQDSLSELSDTEHPESTLDNSIFNGAASADAADSDTEQVDLAELHALEQEAERAWTKEEIRKMMHILKEQGMGPFIKEYVVVQQIPVVKLLFAFGISLCSELRAKSPATLLYFLRVAISRIASQGKATSVQHIEDAVSLIQRSRRIIILTGAGISVSCGIPDFRSRNGLYASLKANGQYDLDDPQQMFDIHYFKEHPAVRKPPLFLERTSNKLVPSSFASQIYPSNFIPSPCHRFIKLIEDKGKLLRNYTQNIDTLETKQASSQVPGVEIESEILERRVPYCKKGKKRREWDDDSDDRDDDIQLGIMKPDITFFGEKLNDEFDRALIEDRDKVDLLLVIGTSLKVSPVSEILSHLPHSVPQILINRTPIRHINPDVVLLGNADEIVQYLCERLHWQLPPPTPKQGSHLDVPAKLGKNGKRSSTEMMGGGEPARVGESHVWLFQGAEGGKWVEDIREKYNHIVKPNVPHSEPGAKKARVT